MQHVDDELPAVLFRPHGYHQPLSRPDVAVAQLSGPVAPLRRRRFARTTLNLSLIGHRSSVRPHMPTRQDKPLPQLAACTRPAPWPPPRWSCCSPGFCSPGGLRPPLHAVGLSESHRHGGPPAASCSRPTAARCALPSLECTSLPRFPLTAVTILSTTATCP